MISGFEPVVGNDPYILIVGSLPSVTSLDKQEYYGFAHNRFWPIIQRYFNSEWNCYEDKITCLKSNHIALWDVIQECEREGSLDSKIKNVKANDIASLLEKYPSIKVVLCNGKKSYDVFQKHFSHLTIECICMPSTSNANRLISQDQLFEQWIQTFDKYLSF